MDNNSDTGIRSDDNSSRSDSEFRLWDYAVAVSSARGREDLKPEEEVVLDEIRSTQTVDIPWIAPIAGGGTSRSTQVINTWNNMPEGHRRRNPVSVPHQVVEKCLKETLSARESGEDVNLAHKLRNEAALRFWGLESEVGRELVERLCATDGGNKSGKIQMYRVRQLVDNPGNGQYPVDDILKRFLKFSQAILSGEIVIPGRPKEQLAQIYGLAKVPLRSSISEYDRNPSVMVAVCLILKWWEAGLFRFKAAELLGMGVYEAHTSRRNSRGFWEPSIETGTWTDIISGWCCANRGGCKISDYRSLKKNGLLDDFFSHAVIDANPPRGKLRSLADYFVSASMYTWEVANATEKGAAAHYWDGEECLAVAKNLGKTERDAMAIYLLGWISTVLWFMEPTSTVTPDAIIPSDGKSRRPDWGSLGGPEALMRYCADAWERSENFL